VAALNTMKRMIGHREIVDLTSRHRFEKIKDDPSPGTTGFLCLLTTVFFIVNFNIMDVFQNDDLFPINQVKSIN